MASINNNVIIQISNYVRSVDIRFFPEPEILSWETQRQFELKICWSAPFVDNPRESIGFSLASWQYFSGKTRALFAFFAHKTTLQAWYCSHRQKSLRQQCKKQKKHTYKHKTASAQGLQRYLILVDQYLLLSKVTSALSMK